MLTAKQFKAMKHLYETQGQTFCFSLDEAREFCKKMKLTNKTASIIEDHKAGKFYIESSETIGLIRNFETEHKICDTKAVA